MSLMVEMGTVRNIRNLQDSKVKLTKLLINHRNNDIDDDSSIAIPSRVSWTGLAKNKSAVQLINQKVQKII